MATTKHWRIDAEGKLIGDYPDDVLFELTRAAFGVATGTLDEYVLYGLSGKLAPVSPTFEQIETGNIFDTGGSGGLFLAKNLSTTVSLEVAADYGSNSRLTRTLAPGQMQIVDYYDSTGEQIRISGVGAVCPYAVLVGSVV